MNKRGVRAIREQRHVGRVACVVVQILEEMRRLLRRRVRGAAIMINADQNNVMRELDENLTCTKSLAGRD